MCSHESEGLSRRAALKSGAAALASIVALPRALEALTFDTADSYIDAARRVRAWLSATASRGPNGLTWAADPLAPKSESYDLYNGMPGVVLFLLEYAHATGDRQALADAESAAKTLYARLTSTTETTESLGTGLYVGVAGLAFVFYETYRATDNRAYLDATHVALKILKDAAKPVEHGVEWGPTVDIISGTAGSGLTLLYFAHYLRDDSLVDLAARAARRLAALGVAEHGGLKWAMNPTFARRMPNFSHGTAGVAYFLATVAERTGDAQLLDVAAQGATYLRNVATRTANDGWKVFHSEPGNESLYYLSWCHGPAGTARLYERLGRSTKYKSFGAEVAKLAQGTVDSGVPGQSPGYWNNISQCCGNCGVVEFFTALHRVTREQQHLDFAKRVMDDALGRATAEGGGLKWIQAEHRVQPKLLIAQTGLMQGAAGVGLALLHLDGAINGRPDKIVLPDNPWRSAPTRRA
ncbi:MAG: lanthionine synthetase LanC family protein [Gemmatimonadaceae bacterium]